MTTNKDAQFPEKKITTPVSKTSYTRTGVLTLLTLMIIAGFSGALYINLKLGQKVNALALEMYALKQQQQQTKTQLDSTHKSLLSAQLTLNDKLGSLSKSLSSAMQEHLYQNNDWLLQKARYYLEMVEINAHWSDSTHTTIALFQQADALLVNLHEPQLFTIRQAIATDIAKLQTIPTLDIAGLLAKLDATQHVITTCPSKNPLALTKTKTLPNATIKTPATWREQLQASLDLLKKLVIIHHHNEAIQPLLTPEYETLLRENIRLNLQETQWAVLQKNQAVYDLSLTQAIDNITMAFDQNAASTQTLIEQLHALQSTQLKSETPPLGQSLWLLNQFIESKRDASKKMPVSGENS